MFAVWVAAPFVGLLGILRVAERTSPKAARILQAMAMIVSGVTLLLYAGFTLHPLGHSAAAPFLLVPVCMWAATASMFFYARRNRTQISR
jgi:hypothetical protein